METTTINLLFCRLNQFLLIYKTYFTVFHPSPAFFSPFPRNISNNIISLYLCTIAYSLKSGVRFSEVIKNVERKGDPDDAWQHFCFQIS
jgi:hypothetical protein